MERATGFLLFLSDVTDEINWYGKDLDDHDVSADVTYEDVFVRIGQFCLGATGGVIEGGEGPIKDSSASLDFPSGLLGEIPLGLLHSFP